ncbi:MAG: hypothetical protein ACRDRL_10625 [Sciscionella sp.]
MHLAVDAFAVAVVSEASFAEAEHAYQVGVDCGDIVVDEDGNPPVHRVVEHGYVLQELTGGWRSVASEGIGHAGQAASS